MPDTRPSALVPSVYQLRVVVRGVSPLIWRRLLIPADSTTIASLHAVLQIAFGWNGDHLHRFVVHGREYGIAYPGGPSFGDDPRRGRSGSLGRGRRSGDQLTAEDVPAEATALKAELTDMLPFAPIVSLLIELDKRTGYLDCFIHAGGRQARSHLPGACQARQGAGVPRGHRPSPRRLRRPPGEYLTARSSLVSHIRPIFGGYYGDPTTEEIRQRVEAADRARIQTHADTAAAIATAVEQRTKARAELTALETSIATQITASATVMSLHELAEFTGIPVTELRAAGRHTRPRKSTRGRTPRGRSPRVPARTGSADAPQPSEATNGNIEQSA